MHSTIDFNKAPLLVIWEVTRACALACQHCRANAMDVRHPAELTLDEGKQLLDGIAAMGTPLVVFSGGDPLQRDDLEDLIQYAHAIGLRTGTIPAATDRLTLDRVRSLKEAGLDQLAFSLDGPTKELHDAFRRVPGAFEKTMRGAAYAHEVGLRLQINTVFCAWNFPYFDQLATLVESLGIVFWEVFFLVPTGRGSMMESCSAEQCEQLFKKLYDLAELVDFTVKITEAPHYRRYIAEQDARSDTLSRGQSAGMPRRPTRRAVNAGRGFCFVDHVGNVCPSGFLPISAGNVRYFSIADIYRDSNLFRELRDTTRLKGRCAACMYRDMCSGSRSRAYAVTGDYMAEEPLCAFHS